MGELPHFALQGEFTHNCVCKLYFTRALELLSYSFREEGLRGLFRRTLLHPTLKRVAKTEIEGLSLAYTIKNE